MKTVFKHAWRYTLVLRLLVTMSGTLAAQEPETLSEPSPITMYGTLQLATEIRSGNTNPYAGYGNGTALTFYSTLSLNDNIRIPVDAYITTRKDGTGSSLTQFGIHPEISDWLKLHGGSYQGNLSELTIGTTRLFGGAMELTPGNLRVGAIYGRLQEAHAGDTTLAIEGAYTRTAIGARLGVGSDDNYFDVNLLRIADDTTSISSGEQATAPQENALFTAAYAFTAFGEGLTVSGETAISGYTSDTRFNEMDGGYATPLFTPRYASQFDGATFLRMAIRPDDAVTIALNGKWVGPGYVTLAQPYMQNDVMEATISPSFRLFHGGLSMRTSLGVQYNNLRNGKLGTTRRLIGSAYASIQPSNTVGIDIGYTNYGMRNSATNDTFGIQNLAQSISISPRYSFQGFGAAQSVSASYMVQQTDAENGMYPGTESSYHTGTAFWNASWPSTLALTTTATYSANRNGEFSSTITSLHQTVGYSFLGNSLSASLSGGITSIAGLADGTQYTAGMNLRYDAGMWGSFLLNLTKTDGTYHSPPNNATQDVYGTLQYMVNF